MQKDHHWIGPFGIIPVRFDDQIVQTITSMLDYFHFLVLLPVLLTVTISVRMLVAPLERLSAIN